MNRGRGWYRRSNEEVREDHVKNGVRCPKCDWDRTVCTCYPLPERHPKHCLCFDCVDL